MNTTTVRSNIHDYQIFYESDFSFARKILSIENAIFIIDENIIMYYPIITELADRSRLIKFTAIEESKTLAAAEKIIDRIIELKPNKKTTVVSFGGGITQDVTGFVASVFYRGLRWVYVPTTLLAQADSCMGSKTSLNYKSYKNILGTFYPPHEIYICPDFLLTLKAEDFYSGMGEVAKLHLMSSEKDVKDLTSKIDSVNKKEISVLLHLIKQSLKIKWSYMEQDEFDAGKRNLLNYGHCFGHAIESATLYKIPHGQAVIIGMIIANSIAADKGLISQEKKKSIDDSLLFPLLKSNYKILKNISADAVIDGIKQDKKRIGTGLPLILLHHDYTLEKITNLSIEKAKEAYSKFIQEYC